MKKIKIINRSWRHYLCWHLLWWGVMSFQNFSHGLPCFKRINRVCIIDGFLRNLAKMFLGYQCAKVYEAFLMFQILLFLGALMWQRSVNIQFASSKDISSANKYWKSLTDFCSLSTDWHCAVCLVVRASREAGNSVQQNNASFVFEGLHMLTIVSNLLILNFISFMLIYTFLWF